MIRYTAFLLTLVLLLVAGTWAGRQLQLWRTSSRAHARGPIVDQWLQAPLPANLTELDGLLRDLGEMSQGTEVQAIGQFRTYALLSQALGEVPDKVGTGAEAVAWSAKNPDRLKQREASVAASALSMELAPAGTLPPTTGRPANLVGVDLVDEGGGVWSAQHRPPYFFLATVHNRLRVAPASLSFYLVPLDDAGQPTALPQHTYLWCATPTYSGVSLKLPAGGTATLPCEFRAGVNEPFSPAQLASVLQRLRSGSLRSQVWIKELNLQIPSGSGPRELRMRDMSADAEYGRPPSANIEAGLAYAPEIPGQGRAKLMARTTCEERADCEARRMDALTRWQGPIQDLNYLLVGMIPGAVVAGLWRLVTPAGRSPKRALLLLLLLSLAAFPVAWSRGGSGYGPLAIVLLLAYLSLGFWVGLGLGSLVLGRR